MKWFKHMALASHDEKLAEILELHGASGYGVFWLIVEAVASQMDESNKCEVKYSIKKWASITHVDSRTLTRYLQTFCKITLIVLHKCDKFVTIRIPKLLELRDNYTKNLQVTSLPTDKQEVEVEVEVEVDKYTQDDYSIAEKIKDRLAVNWPNYPAIENANIKKWADEIRKLREIDKFDIHLIDKVSSWALTDEDFWKEQFKSVSGLRKKSKSNGFSKFENMMAAMQRDPNIKKDVYKWVEN